MTARGERVAQLAERHARSARGFQSPGDPEPRAENIRSRCGRARGVRQHRQLRRVTKQTPASPLGRVGRAPTAANHRPAFPFVPPRDPTSPTAGTGATVGSTCAPLQMLLLFERVSRGPPRLTVVKSRWDGTTATPAALGARLAIEGRGRSPERRCPRLGVSGDGVLPRETRQLHRAKLVWSAEYTQGSNESSIYTINRSQPKARASSRGRWLQPSDNG